MSRRSVGLLVAALLGACASQPAVPAQTPGAALRGVVRAHDGRPLAAAQVHLACSCLASNRETLTAADGSYGFEDLPAGTYSVEARHGGLQRAHTVQVPQGSKQWVVLELWPTSTIRLSGSRAGHSATSGRM